MFGIISWLIFLSLIFELLQKCQEISNFLPQRRKPVSGQIEPDQ
jgi:hypothetical protein